jgi:Concanavalin A-like lectin/glucanases superfamily
VAPVTFFATGRKLSGRNGETAFEPTMKTLLIAATAKFALRTCLIAAATCILVSNPPAEADPVAPCIPPPPNLVAWWSGDGHPNDTQGTNNGTFPAATYASGKADQAFSLNGSSAFVEIPDSPSVSIAGAITLDAWINPTTTVAFQTILSKYDSPANQLSYILGVNAGGGLRFVVYQTGDGSILRGVDTATGLVPTGTFTHVAATFDPATQAIKIYPPRTDRWVPLRVNLLAPIIKVLLAAKED